MLFSSSCPFSVADCFLLSAELLVTTASCSRSCCSLITPCAKKASVFCFWVMHLLSSSDTPCVGRENFLLPSYLVFYYSTDSHPQLAHFQQPEESCPAHPEALPCLCSAPSPLLSPLQGGGTQMAKFLSWGCHEFLL